MKLTAATLILFFISASLLSVGRAQQEPANKPPSQIEKLEAQFKQLDEEAGSVTVEASGDKESSGRLKITVESKARTLTDSAAANKSGGPTTTWTKETVLDIDLSQIDVPDEYVQKKIAAALLEPKGTCPGVDVRKIEPGEDYEVVHDYPYNGGAYTITALAGFRYDRASVPRIVWVLIDKDSLSNVAPLFHDLLYRNGGELPQNQVSPYRTFSRKDTDDLFLELMNRCGVKPWRARAAYRAVREFAGPAWKSH